ncbi:hypothetical protein [Amycolatopsis arida]|uniref:hypothetical protein n=1 Tax=Amycolatopsis arida TaxID=587909 RepID=UPI00106513FC|nr:hypothetical protein [Amycolatopsis arida]
MTTTDRPAFAAESRGPGLAGGDRGWGRDHWVAALLDRDLTSVLTQLIGCHTVATTQLRKERFEDDHAR